MSTVLFDQKIGGSVGSRIGRRAGVAMLSMLCALTFGLTSCTGSGAAVSDATANTVSGELAGSIEEAVTSAMGLSKSTAAVVGVWQGEDAYVQGFGDGVDANSLFRGAQATQPVVCAALLDLVAEGTLTLNRKVIKDIPRQVGVEDITYGELCTGTSGLADFKRGFTDIFANNPMRQWSDRELLAQGLARSPLSWPGLDLHIADTNAVLLGRALHQATGTDLSELLTQHVFSKAEMPSSYYPENPLTDTTVDGGMDGYTFPKKSGDPLCDVGPVEVEEVSPSMLAGAGATVTTVSDLKNFYEHYLGGTFGADTSALITETRSSINPKRDKAGKPVEDADEPTDKEKAAERFWGFGLEKVDSLYGKSGSMTGSITAAFHDPETDFTVVVALNNSTVGAGFARNLALQLAALAGQETSVSAEDRAASLAKAAICQEEEGEEGEAESE